MITKEEKLEKLLDVITLEDEITTEDIKFIFDNSSLELTEYSINNIKDRFRGLGFDAIIRQLEEDGVTEKGSSTFKKEKFYVTKKDLKYVRSSKGNLVNHLFIVLI